MTFCPVFMQADSTFENTMEGLHFLLLPLSEYCAGYLIRTGPLSRTPSISHFPLARLLPNQIHDV
jgi:hypothetical protein